MSDKEKGNEETGTRQQRWVDAANEAVDAIARLIELQEGMESRANFIDVSSDELEAAEPGRLAQELNLLDEAINLNLKDALDTVEEAVHQEIPEEVKETEEETNGEGETT